VIEDPAFEPPSLPRPRPGLGDRAGGRFGCGACFAGVAATSAARVVCLICGRSRGVVSFGALQGRIGKYNDSKNKNQILENTW
jgi:hypothetical protein